MANGYNQAPVYGNMGYPVQNYTGYQYQNPYLNNNPYTYMPAQQRLQALESQYPQYGQTVLPVQAQPTQQQEPVQQLAPNNQANSIIVNSEDEARKYMPDMSGMIQTFSLKENGKIIKFFTKQINDELDVDFNIYEKIEKKAEKKIETPIVKEESSDVLISIQNIIQTLDDKIDNLKSLDDKINDLKSLYNKLDDLNLEILDMKEVLRDELNAKQEHDKSSSSKSTRSGTTGK